MKNPWIVLTGICSVVIGIVLLSVIMGGYTSLLRAQNRIEATRGLMLDHCGNQIELVPDLISMARELPSSPFVNTLAGSKEAADAVLTEARKYTEGPAPLQMASLEKAMARVNRDISGLISDMKKYNPPKGLADLEKNLLERQTAVFIMGKRYNKEARYFNVRKTVFPGFIVARLFGLKEISFAEFNETLLSRKKAVHPDPALYSAFSMLSGPQQQALTTEAEYRTYAKGDVVFTQEVSEVNRFLILSRGKAGYFFHPGPGHVPAGHGRISSGSGSPPFDGKILDGSTFGGLSLLFNDHMAIHTLVCMEETVMLAVKPSVFLKICRQVPGFLKSFTDEFGKCMLNPEFAAVVARRHQDRKFNLPFFNQPVSAIFRPNISACSPETCIREAAGKMSRQRSSAILVKSGPGTVQGIVTDADLRKAAGAASPDLEGPVSRILSSPLETISADRQVFEAFLTMVRQDRRHLAVTGKSGDISGIISEKDLITAQTRSIFLLIKAVKSAKVMSDLENIHKRLEKMLLDSIRNGSGTDTITRLITTFSDAIIDRVITFSLAEAGPAPCAFAFLTMGSEGREEQTLITDQDNAIVYEDIKDPAKAGQAKTYFDCLAGLICQRLDMAGYRFCEGGNMAQNPRWCQPLSVWKSYFKKWIRSASPEDLLHSSIFFDFRGTWGQAFLADELKAYLLKSVANWSGFLRNLTENAMHFTPPLGRFGKFVVETKGKHKDAFDIKMAILPIIDLARIYALKNGIDQTNTLARLFRLYTRHALTAKEYTDLVQSYNFLMGLRFRRQITTLMDEKEAADNYITPSNLSYLDQVMLKEIFRLIDKLQQKLHIEFTGVA